MEVKLLMDALAFWIFIWIQFVVVKYCTVMNKIGTGAEKQGQATFKGNSISSKFGTGNIFPLFAAFQAIKKLHICFLEGESSAERDILY